MAGGVLLGLVAVGANRSAILSPSGLLRGLFFLQRKANFAAFSNSSERAAY